MSYCKKKLYFIVERINPQTIYQLANISLSLYRFFNSSYYSWLSYVFLSAILLQMMMMVFFLKRLEKTNLLSYHFLVNVISIIIHGITIYWNNDPSWTFFYGMELAIVLQLNFQEIHNRIIRFIILGFLFLVFIKEYNNDFKTNSCEVFYLIVYLIIFECSIQTHKNELLIKNKNNPKQKLKKPTINLKLDTSLNKVEDKSLTFKPSLEKNLMNSFGIGVIVIDQNLNIVFSNDFLFELCNTINLEDGKNFFLSLQENMELNSSNFKKISKYELNHFFKRNAGSYKNIKIDEIPENPRLIKERSFESSGYLNFIKEKASDKDSESNFKSWKKKNLSKNLEDASLLIGNNEKKSTPYSVQNYLERLFDCYKQETTSDPRCNSNDLNENKKYSIYADCKIDGKNLILSINFTPLETCINSNSNTEVLITIRKLNEIEKKFLEEGRAKDKVLGSFSHELRTPINGLINMLDLMESHTEEFKIGDIEHNGSHFKEMLSGAIISSQLLLYEIEDFIEYFSYRNEILELHSDFFDLRSSFQEIQRIFSYIALKKGLELKVQIDETIPSVIYNDHQKLKQIIYNLVNNAIRFTDSGFIKIKAELDGYDYVIISLLDSGSGIDENQFNSLGKINYDMNENQKSKCGLGLFISNILSLLIEGKSMRNRRKGLVVYSEVGKGTCFSFRLKCDIASKNLCIGSNRISKTDSKLSSLSLREILSKKVNTFSSKNAQSFINSEMISNRSIISKKSESEKKASKAKFFGNILGKIPFSSYHLTSITEKLQCSCVKILIVDDNPFNIEVCLKLFQGLNFSCDTAFNGLEAIEKIERICKEENEPKFCEKCKFYKLILMDIDMPMKNGIEATREILSLLKSKNRTVSIVGLSAFDQENIKRRGIEAGMEDYITKPISFKKVNELIFKYINS